MRKLLDMSKRFDVHVPLSPKHGISGYVSRWHKYRGDHPTLMFRNVIGHEGTSVAMNLWDKARLDRRLGAPAKARDAWFTNQIKRWPGIRAQRFVNPPMESLNGLGELPILHHQPRETAPYLTSFLGCIHDPKTGGVNTGFYRGQVIDSRSVAVFMDARTDAHTIYRERLKTEQEIPFVMYAGGDIRCYLIAASGLAREIDSFDMSATLGDAPLALACFEDVAFAADAEIVLQGTLSALTMPEGPFGEFKGYYAASAESPVFHVDSILTTPGYIYPGLLCGKQDGLTLMSYSNELLMAQHLAGLGFSVDRVTYDLAAFGEYQVEIVTGDLRQDGLLRAAMDFDRRAKTFYVTDGHNTLAKILSYSPLDILHEPYIRYGKPEGQRMGVLAHDVQARYDWSEF